MRWIKFRINGEFHFIKYRVDLSPDNIDITTHFKREYFTMCGRKIIANPDKVATRDAIYLTSIEEYCEECLECLE